MVAERRRKAGVADVHRGLSLGSPDVIHIPRHRRKGMLFFPNYLDLSLRLLVGDDLMPERSWSEGMERLCTITCSLLGLLVITVMFVALSYLGTDARFSPSTCL